MSLDQLNTSSYDPTKLRVTPKSPTITPSSSQQVPQESSSENPVISFAKNLPTTIARGVTQPVEFIGKTANNIADFLVNSKTVQHITNRVPDKNIDPNLKLTLPGQSSPLIDTTKFDSVTQAAGSGLEAGLNIFLGMTGLGGMARNVAVGSAEQVAKTVIKQGGGSMVRNLAKTALKDFGIGSVYGVATEAQGEGGTFKDYAKSAAFGGVLGAAIPPVFGKTMRILGKGVGAASRVVSSQAEGFATRVESKLSAQSAEASSGLRYREAPSTKTLSIGDKVLEASAKVIRTSQALPDKIKTKGLNDLHPVYVFQKKINELTGLTLDFADAFQVAKGKGAGMATSRWRYEYEPMAQSYGDDWKYTKELSNYLDDIDRLHSGNDITGEKGLADALGGIEALKQHLGAERFAKVQQGSKDLQVFLSKELDSSVASGVISPEQAKAYRDAHPNYIPHSVIDFLSKEEGGKVASRKSGGNSSFSITDSGFKKAEGSVRQIEDIDTAVERMLFRNHIINQKNIAEAGMISAARDTGLITPLRTAEKVQERIALATEIKGLSETNSRDITIAGDLTGRGKELTSRVKAQSKTVAELMDEAQAMASEFDAPSKVNRVLDRVANWERKIAEIQNDPTFSDVKALQSVIDNREAGIAELRSAIKETADIHIKPIDIPAGQQKISYFKNGIREDWLVPEDVGNALRSLEPDAATTLMQWVGNSKTKKLFVLGPANAIRKLTVGIQPVFSLFTNPLRDIQTTSITSPVEAKDLAYAASRFTGKGLIRSMFPKLTNIEVDNMYKMALESGAFSSSVFKEEATGNIGRFNRVTDSWGSRVKHPIDTLQRAGMALEENTRLAVFSNALRNGQTVEAASLAARNSTVDFTKAGSLTRQLNQVIPFLNARIQGFANMVNTAKTNPELFARNVMWNAAAPAALLYAHNETFSSYQNIPDYEKQKYFVVMVGENPGFDTKGSSIMVPHYIKIPKGEVQQAVGMVVDRIFDHGKKQYPDSTAKFLATLVANTNPISGGGGGGASSILPIPAGAQQFAELAFNKNYFTGQEIIPQYTRFGGESFQTKDLPKEYQYNPDTTSNVAIKLGKMLNTSPAQVDYLLKTGVLNDLTKMVDRKYDSRKDFFQNMSNMPFLRTVFGSRTGGITQDQKQFMDQLKKDYNSDLLDSFFQNMPQ